MFEEKYARFWTELGECKKMVLSTSLNDTVTSRAMSIVILDRKLLFQTDKTFRKYRQLKGNPRAALCADNIQIEGQCREIGIPKENRDFCDAYARFFPDAYRRYTQLKEERLFDVTPVFIEKWIYVDGIPYMEIFDVTNKNYRLEQYRGV